MGKHDQRPQKRNPELEARLREMMGTSSGSRTPNPTQLRDGRAKSALAEMARAPKPGSRPPKPYVGGEYVTNESGNGRDGQRYRVGRDKYGNKVHVYEDGRAVALTDQYQRLYI